jgi:hypothetical protein
LKHAKQNKTVDSLTVWVYCIGMGTSARTKILDASAVFGWTEAELAYRPEEPQSESVIYVLHFERAYHHAKHYIGIALDGDVNRRAFEHVTGVGSPLVKAVVGAGIEVFLTLTVNGDRGTERRMHNRHGTEVCPKCNPTNKRRGKAVTK